MAASTSGALKALIEGAGLSITAYRDRQPENQEPPYVVIHEAISITPEKAFPQLADPEGHVVEQVQIDLWERWRDPTDGHLIESYTLGDALAKLLRAPSLASPPTHVSGVRIVSGPLRLVEVEENLVHKVFNVQVHRVLQRS